MVDFVILDLDDTICDYSGIELEAQLEISKILGFAEDASSNFWKIFKTVSGNLYRKMGEGSISLSEFRLGRFKDSLTLYYRNNVPSIDSDILNQLFMDITNNHIRLFPDTLGFLDYLRSNKFKVILYTNGPDATQRQKIKKLGISGYFDFIYTSQETGLYKPSPKVYQYLMDKHSFRASQVVNIGDSFELDFPGAKACGIKSILVNRRGAVIDKEAISVSSLSEVQDKGILTRTQM